MTGHDIDLVALYVPRQDGVRLAGNNPLSQLLGHPLHIVWVQPQLVGNLGIRQVQTHEIQTQNPNPQRLMMPRQHRLRQIVKIAVATLTPIFLSCGLSGVPPLLRDVRCATVRTTDPVGPTQLAQGFIALDVIQQVLKVDHRRETLGRSGSERAQCSPFHYTQLIAHDSLERT